MGAGLRRTRPSAPRLAVVLEQPLRLTPRWCSRATVRRRIPKSTGATVHGREADSDRRSVAPPTAHRPHGHEPSASALATRAGRSSCLQCRAGSEAGSWSVSDRHRRGATTARAQRGRRLGCLPTDVPRRGHPSSGRPTRRGRRHAASPEARIPRHEARRAQDCSSRVSGTAPVAPAPNSPGCAEENGPARSSADWPAATVAKSTHPLVCRPVAPVRRRTRRYPYPHPLFVDIDLVDGTPRRRCSSDLSARRRVSRTVLTVGRSARCTPRGCAHSSGGRVRRPDSGPCRAWRACAGARPC